MARGDQRDIFRGRLILAGVLLGAVVLVGGGGYYVLGDGRWSFEEIFYFTVITLSTVGFGETLPGMHDVPYARLWTILMIFMGSGTLLYFISTLTAFIVEGDIQGAIRRNRMQKRIDHLSGHYIVCGVGSTGIHCVEELINTHTSFVVIDRDEERLLMLADKFGPQHFLYVVGDATEDEVLESAGLGRSIGVISTLTDDKDNLYVTVTAYQHERARAERGEFRIVSKSIDPTARGKLLAAGATRVVSPSEIGGMRMVSEMVRPAVVEFLDLMLRDPEKNLRIEEVSIPDDSPLIGVRLRDTAIRARTRVLVIAVKHGGEETRYTYNPGPDLEIEKGMILIVLAETVEMNKLRDGIAQRSIGRL
ncbi:MAG: potassium channel protein [Myxococcota bacterium]|nr:potassium channel protein [Myxococcota bacterium]